MVFDTPRILHAGDRYLLVEFGDELSLELNFKCLALARAIEELEIDGIDETVPSYSTLLVKFDAAKLSRKQVEAHCRAACDSVVIMGEFELPSRKVEIPIAYNDRWTRECVDDYCRTIKQIEPNPELIARINGLSGVDELIEKHSTTEWWVGHIGFLAGLPVMMSLNPECQLHAPRYDPPRMWTPKGTVAIGGAFTAIYPMVTPDGYQVLGRTPVPVFDPEQRLAQFAESPFLFRIGDRVAFRPISEEKFEEIEAKVEEGTYTYGVQEGETLRASDYQQRVLNV